MIIRFYNSRKNLCRVLFLAIATLCLQTSYAAFNGSYTLNPAVAASASNYQNMASFARDLYGGGRTDGGPSNATGGVTGPVVLRLAPGLTLTEQAEFRLATGASATNTITIKGNLSILQFTSSSTTNKHTVWMNGAKYYTIDSLDIRALGVVQAWGIRFSNDASFNRILRCNVSLPNIAAGVGTSTTSTSVMAAICFTASSSILDYTSNSSASSAANGSNNLIQGCTIGGSATTLGPTYGIYENQTSTGGSTSGNNSFINNKIQHFYQEGIASHTADGITIIGNDINRQGNTAIPSAVVKAINLYNNVRAVTNPITVTNNIMHDFSTTNTLYGYYHINSSTFLTNFDGGTKPCIVNNNKVYNFTTNGTNTFYGIYFYTVRNSGGSSVSNNEIFNNVTPGTNYSMYIYNVDKTLINANIIRNNRGATFYGISDQGYPTNSIFSNNLLFKNIATGNEYGMYIYNNSDLWLGNVYANNTIAFDSVGWTSGTTYGMYLNGGVGRNKTNNIIYNNIVYIGHKGSSASVLKYGIYNFNGFSGYTEDRNNVHFDTTNVTPATTYYGTEYSGPLQNAATLANWVTVGGSSRDLNLNPKFVKSNYSDYRVGNSALYKIGNNAGVTKDIKGAGRVPGSPDLGAFESPFNLTVSAVNINSGNSCLGYADSVRLTVNNTTGYVLKGLQLGVSINGVPYTAGTMATVNIGSTTLTFPTPVKYTQSGTKIIKFYSINTDASPSDDTLTRTINVLPAPGGSVITLKPGSKGVFNHPLGYDVTAFDEPMTYTMSSPRKYTDLEFGSKWNVQTWATFADGSMLPPSAYTFTHPSATELAFKPSIAFVDKMVTLYTKVTDLASGCDTTFKRTLFVAPKGVLRYTVPSSVCYLTDIDFVNNSTISSGDLTFTWNFGDGSLPYSGKFAKHNYAAAGKYTVKLSSVSVPFGFVADTSFDVVVQEIPRTNFNKINACEGNDIVLTNTTSVNSGTPTYTWDFGDGSPLSNAVNVTKKYAAPGVYTVKLTASKNGCEQTISKNVYQFAKPNASFVKTSGQCLNAPFTFNNTSTLTIGNNSTLWDFNDNAGSTTTDHNPEYTFKTAGTKNVKLLVISEFGCRDSVIKAITVEQAPVADFTFASACDVKPTNFTNTSNLNNQTLLSYNWDFGDGTTSSATNPVKNWSKAGVKQVKLRTVLFNGCSSEITKTVDVGVQPKVDFDLGNACSGSPVSFENLTNYNPSKILYTWSFGDNTYSNANSPNHIYNTNSSQTYTVKLKGSIISGCSDSISKTVTITALPSTCSFDINGNTLSATKTNFAFVPKGGSMSGVTYSWSTGDGNTLTSTGAGVNYRYDAPGVFCIRMVATNVGGCQCEATRCITLTTDINNAVSMNNALAIYPNPSNGIFTVRFDVATQSGMTVNVYNSVGMLVKTVTADGSNTSVDLSEFANGVYVVKVLADGYTATQKITLAR